MSRRRDELCCRLEGEGPAHWVVSVASRAPSRGSCVDELCEVVGGADERPFLADLVDAAQQELAKAPGLLDLAEHGFDDLLAQPIAAAPAGVAELVAHGRNKRSSTLRLGLG